VKTTRPGYPADALKACIEGDVVLRIRIDDTGRVTEAEPIRSIPELDAAAIECVKEWRYEPARRDGRAVGATSVVTLEFRVYDQGDYAACDGARKRAAPVRHSPAGGTRASVNVDMEYSGSQIRFNVKVANSGTTGDIVGVVIGRDRPLLEKPFGIGKPKGWQSQLVKRESKNEAPRWEVWLSCDPVFLERVARSSRPADEVGGVRCAEHAIAPGDKTAFSLAVQSRRSVGLGPGSVAALFSGGEPETTAPTP
jgi:TonB family protein